MTLRFPCSRAAAGPLAMAFAVAGSLAGCPDAVSSRRSGASGNRATEGAPATSAATTPTPSGSVAPTTGPGSGSANPSASPGASASPSASTIPGASPGPTIDPGNPSQEVFFLTEGNYFHLTLPPATPSDDAAAGLPTTKQLSAYVWLADGGTSSAIVWKSGDDKIATVDGTGLVTAVGRGQGAPPWQVNIFAVAADDLHSATRTVEVFAEGEVALTVQ